MKEYELPESLKEKLKLDEPIKLRNQIKKELEELLGVNISDETFSNILTMCMLEDTHEPASEDLEKAAVGIGLKLRDALILEGCDMCHAEIYAAIAQNKFKAGANWQKQQFEKNRLAACDRQTREEAEREQDFVMPIFENEHRQPTYSDAIEYGMKLQKKQMIDKACEWLLNNIRYYSTNALGAEYMCNDFRKAMEAEK